MQDGLGVQLHSKSLEPCPMSPSTQGKGWWGECACPSAIPAIPKAPSPPWQWQWQWRGGMATGGANGHTYIGKLKVGVPTTGPGAIPHRGAIGVGWGGAFRPRVNLMFSRPIASL